MELSPDDVRDVVRVLDSSGLDELHRELADRTPTVRRGGAAGWTSEQQVLRRPVVEGGTEPTADTEPERPRAAVAEGLVAVHPPLLGTFYRAPKPGAPAFVDVGDEVDVDTVVGIVETMKMMTPVHAGVGVLPRPGGGGARGAGGRRRRRAPRLRLPLGEPHPGPRL